MHIVFYILYRYKGTNQVSFWNVSKLTKQEIEEKYVCILFIYLFYIIEMKW